MHEYRDPSLDWEPMEGKGELALQMEVWLDQMRESGESVPIRRRRWLKSSQ